MLSKLCSVCLLKYVRAAFLCSRRRRECTHIISIKWWFCTHMRYFPLALPIIVVHNYTDTNGNRFTSARTTSAGLERTGRHPPAPTGCDRSSLSRQRVLRSERPGAGQVRDAAQCPERGPCGGGGGPGLWPVPPGVLCHSGVVPARGLAGAAAAQARAEAAPQAQRRSAGCPVPGHTG